jgi:putative transposase
VYRVRGHIPGGSSAHPYSNIVRSFPEIALRHVLDEYIEHYHTERPHQGKGNVIPFPVPRPEGAADGPIECRERLGGLLKYYNRKAA